MFVDFNRVFKEKPQTQIMVPEVLVEYMNSQLPKGVKYEVQEDGTCEIVGDGEPINIGGFVFQLSKEQQELLGANCSEDDIINYFYNAQKPIPLKLKKDGFITLNGKEFPIEQLNYRPMNPIHYEKGELWLSPHPFGKPFELKIGCDEYERKLLISRVPTESTHIATFESEKEAPLYLKYHMDEENKTLTANISYNLKYATSIRDIVESTSIYNAYLEGRGYLESVKIQVKENKKKVFDKDSIVFWKKVLAIEEYLGVAFKPPLDDVEFETMCLVETLYQNLINKIPVIDKGVINTINGEFSKTKKEIDELTGKPIYFEFETTSNVELFEAKFELPALVGIFNAVFAGVEVDKNEQKIILKDESKQKKRYSSTLRFRDEEEVKKFKEGDYQQRVALFHDAKKAQEYLK